MYENCVAKSMKNILEICIQNNKYFAILCTIKRVCTRVSQVEANIETKRAIKNSEDTIPNDFFRTKK